MLAFLGARPGPALPAALHVLACCSFALGLPLARWLQLWCSRVGAAALGLARAGSLWRKGPARERGREPAELRTAGRAGP